MCDTFALRYAGNGPSRMIFGKNSDREPNEAHEVIFVKGGNHAVDEIVKCTYLEIPQSELTFDVILCKPAWMWGAEMGVNQHGVVIGNEAIFTRGPQPKTPALTGMDLLRLALERSGSAYDALNCITTLLTTHGQGGNCGYSHPFYYNNSFLIADRREIWVLETVGSEWAARKYENLAAISNALTIQTDWDRASMGVLDGRNFAHSNSDKLITHFSAAAARNDCVLNAVKKLRPTDSIHNVFGVLRSHGNSEIIPTGSLTANTVCMHAGFGPIRINQTTGSMIVEMDEESIQVWITGSSAPCLSLFQPVRLDVFQEDTEISGTQDWRTWEIFHRQALNRSSEFLEEFRKARDEVELQCIDKVNNLQSTSGFSDKAVFDQCKSIKKHFIHLWLEKIKASPSIPVSFIYKKTWDRFNKEGGFILQ